MKRIAFIGLLLALVLAGCGSKEMSWQEQYDLGVRYLSEGNYEQAIIAFTAAIEIDPKQPETYLSLADAYMAQGDTESAKAVLEEGLEATDSSDISARLEEAYEKLSDLYLSTGETERSADILEEGAELLDSERLQEKALQQRADAFSDQELIDLAEQNIWTVYNLRYYIGPGAYFEHSWDYGIEGEHGQWWFPVTDERVRSLADITAYWNQYFSSRCPIPDTIAYREIDGRLYCGNMGVGGDVTLVDYKITDVQQRSGTSVALSGYVLREDWEDFHTVEYKNQFRYLMEFEDGQWKCSGFEEGDLIYDSVPDELEQFPHIFSNTFWRWKLSPTTACYALFYRDGSFSYIQSNTLDYSIGTYEYDGEHLYLNGQEYTRDGQGFVSVEGYDVMGGQDWQYTLQRDDEQRFLELKAQLRNRN